ncbi:MAG TPA: hypothetical protein VHM01_08560 [Alphaproteobacteria bacterium]|nr:hypothetical protein [Alphaproteobacteria bacterium]
MRWYGYLLTAWAAVAATSAAGAAPLDHLSSWGQSGLTIILDGTSNTITFGESTRFDVCFDNVRVPDGITDGTSNTIQFGKSSGLFIVPDGIGPRVPIGSIQDGTSNTIFIGEDVDLCLRNVVIDDDPPAIQDGSSNTIIVGEDSRLDICFRNVTQQIADGTSNTIIIGETSSCFADLQIASVPEPSTLFAGLIALAPLPFTARQRRNRRLRRYAT